jgi:hypothetical protein
VPKAGVLAPKAGAAGEAPKRAGVPAGAAGVPKPPPNEKACARAHGRRWVGVVEDREERCGA